MYLSVTIREGVDDDELTQEVTDSVISLGDEMEGFPDDLLLLRFRIPREELGQPRFSVIVEYQSRLDHDG